MFVCAARQSYLCLHLSVPQPRRVLACHLVRGVAKVVAHACAHPLVRTSPCWPLEAHDNNHYSWLPVGPEASVLQLLLQLLDVPETSEESAFGNDNKVRPIIRLISSSRRAQCNDHDDSSTQPPNAATMRGSSLLQRSSGPFSLSPNRCCKYMWLMDPRT
jgi:hypothetical protein